VDIAVSGFDDIPISRYVNPQLTTVRARITELGALALERLASAIEEPSTDSPRHQTLRADLIVRQSTASITERPSRPRKADDMTSSSRFQLRALAVRSDAGVVCASDGAA
jgi:hypothetical protein